MPNRRPARKQPRRNPPRQPAQRRRKKISPEAIRSIRTLLWLIFFFPVGLYRMWSTSCRWKSGIKYAISTLPALALALLFVWPSMGSTPHSGIELMGNEKTAEVYGPAAPENMVEGYSKPVENTVIVESDDDEDTTYYVYATKDQTCYHRSTCKFAYASGYHFSVYEATMMGYKPCGLCDPPVYGEETDADADSETEEDTEVAGVVEGSGDADKTFEEAAAEDPAPEVLEEVDIINNEV